MLGEAKDEIVKSDEIWDSIDIKGLREQQEKDFGLWGPHEFEMPKSEGKWDDVTTNSPKILANKIMGLLASSWLQLYIDVDEEEEKGRKKLSNTERLANGCIWLADRAAIAVPSGKKIQSALSSYAVIKGGTVKSVYWYTGDDGIPHCSIKTYDPMRCQWIEGEEELLWFCYRNYVTADFIKRTYKKAIKDGFSYVEPDSSGLILSRTFWDEDEWRVAINGEYIDKHRHGLGYIPINVRSCGAAPYMQSEKYKGTMKWSWTSVFANVRDIYDLESKLLSIEISKAIDSGRKDIVGAWDSLLSDNKPPEFQKVGYGAGQRNNILLLDVSKGQEFKGFVEAPGNEVIDKSLSRVIGMNQMGSLDPIAQGVLNRSGSGALAAELRAAALEFTNPFYECVEDDFIWIAEEIVRQFINGQYDRIEIEGRGRKRDKFRIKLEPSDVVEKHFDCELVPDKLRDELQELGAAIQKVSYGLTSKRTARVQHNIVADPDREQDIIDEEKAMENPIYQFEQQAKLYEDKGEDELALAYHALSRLAAQRVIQEAGRAEMGEEPFGVAKRKPPIVSPQMNSANIATQGMRDIGV